MPRRQPRYLHDRGPIPATNLAREHQVPEGAEDDWSWFQPDKKEEKTP